MKKQVSIIWLIISAVLIILTGALLAYVYWQRSEMRNFKEHINIENEREKLEEEYTAIFQEYRQYENNRVWINNDSLIQKLDREKTRVQRLLEELRNRKNIDALTIDSLHKELQCLRNNIKIYQTTIDSLNRENRQLKAEKNDALSRYQKATREADQLQKDNYELNEKVNLAARLEAINIEIRTLNKRGRKSTDKDKVSRLKINFSIARNTMAPTGEKEFTYASRNPTVLRWSKTGATHFSWQVKNITIPCNKLSITPETMKKCTLHGKSKNTCPPGSTRSIYLPIISLLEQKVSL